MTERQAAVALGARSLRHDVEQDNCVEATVGDGVGLMFESGRLTVVTIWGSSRAKTTKGIGIGSTEADVRAAYPALRAEPQAYERAPALDMTVLRKDRRRGFRFVTDGKRRVEGVNAGLAQSIGSLEGCL